MMAALRAGARTSAPPDAVAVVLQASSLLLDYPGPEATVEAQLIAAALAELPAAPGCRQLRRFLDWWGALEPAQREQRYVATFDFDRDVTLFLTEGVPGDPAARAASLGALRRAYDACGAAVARDELPDYLPLMLEAAAQVPACRALLAAQRPALGRLAATLEQRRNPFDTIVGAVLAVLGDVPTAPAGTARPASRPPTSGGRR